MVARVASFEGVNVEAAERTMDQAEAVVLPMIERLTGYEGYTELMASNGKFVSITFFDTEENAKAAERLFDEEMPRKLGDMFQDWEGHRVSVDVYKVYADNRR
jgi:hypothetical protein